jgi:hypothetical protein
VVVVASVVAAARHGRRSHFAQQPATPVRNGGA